MTDDPQIDLAEKERRRREAEWLALMLLLIGDTRRDAVRAAKIGRNAITVARGVFLGHPDTADEGAAPVIAEQMAHAEIEGARRAYRMAGLKPPRIDQATFDRIAAGNAAEAQTVADLTWGVIESKLSPALRGAAGQGIGETVKAIRLAFKEAGVTKSDPSTLELGIERNTVEKHNAGMWKGAREIIDPKHHLVGFEHVSIMDSGTTAMCFAGSTRITPIGLIKRVFLRFYEGEMLVIRTSAGREVKITPNHPVLTARGWLAANELKPCNEIIYSVSNEGFCLECSKHIGMPATFAEIANAAFHPTVSDIKIERATTADFHGDGMRGDSKVCIAEIHRHLMDDREPGRCEQVGDDFLRWFDVRRRIGLACKARVSSHIGRRFLARMTSQHRASLTKCVEDPSPASAQHSFDFDRTASRSMHRQRLLHVGHGRFASTVAGNMWHDTEMAKQVCGRGGADLVLPCQRCGRFSVAITGDNIIDVRREFVAEHVYNLESSKGVYIADGLIVKNCRQRNGLRLPPDHPYWRTNFPSLHWGCRSVLAPLFGSTLTGESKSLPTEPPAPGFGYAPSAELGSYFGVTQ